ncbi:MAG: Co2+/Mg2+ efflux protein ApaG [Oligoflexia bacterium]|nr:Co2+/Mg2+ efflux protein ApaG [Oligoflexia bacterium]
MTENVRVSASCQPLLANSEPARSHFAFSYTIRIENLGEETAQLLERHWIIRSNGQQIAEVVGPGVVGEQPVLEPGAMFEYSSGAVIQDPLGSMEGSYTFRAASGRFFQVAIPRFELLYPIVIH